MASPLKAGKQPVKLASDGARVSKIRRDPPPVVKEIVVRARDESDRRDAFIGIVAFALALFVILLAFAIYSGWTPRQYTVQV